ncbi:MAG: hypothetical protein HYV09_07540 [Deltaproteobacteria bacterium]|nr:hypothetical protein [Deltaproteobacteria bacterium]
MEAHVPSVPEPFFAAVHAWQVPLHGALQHTPSTQLPVRHWLPAPHAVPLAFFATHAPPPQ